MSQYTVEINKNYANTDVNTLSDVANNLAYDLIGTHVNDITLTGTGQSHSYNNTSVSKRVPSLLHVDITKEMIIDANAKMKIKDVEILVPHKVVKVVFEDDTFEKAICHEDDVFNLETAIIVCMTKHLLGGSSKFNNILEKGIKIIENKIKVAEEEKIEQQRIKAKRIKKREKLMKHIAKKEKEAREARIQDTAEAIKRAYEMINTKINVEEE